jgi:serine protease Do
MLILIIQSFIVLFVSTTVAAEDFDPRKIYSETSDAVVLIAGFEPGQRKMSKGTGSIIREDGLILTNAHIIINENKGRPYNELRVYLKPERVSGNFREDTSLRYKADLIAYSENLDLALLKIKSQTISKHSNTLQFSDSDLVSIGDPVLAIGHPEQGGLWTLTTGTISGHISNHRKIRGKNVFQTETSFNRGNSGGPLINAHGHVVGLNSMIARKAPDGQMITGINFSIKSRVAVDWLSSKNFKFKFFSRQSAKSVPPLISNTAKINLIPKIETKINQPSTPKKSLQKSPQVLTTKRPFKEEDLIKRVEYEMEDMINEMKITNFN